MYQLHRRTINVLFTLLVLMVSLCSLAQDENELSADFKNDLQVAFGEKSPEHQAAMVELGQWEAGLQKFLFNSDDDFSQAAVLAAKVFRVDTSKFLANLHDKTAQLDQINDLSYQPIADTLNLLIAKPSISPAAFNILTRLCAHDKLVDYCHANILLQKRIEQDGENLQTYFPPLTQAIEANKTKDIEQLMQQMANSTHSYAPLNITTKMGGMIDDYVADNPIPQSAIDSMVSDYKSVSGVSAEKKAQLEVLMPAYMPSYVKFSYHYLTDIPAYKSLLDYCKSHASAFDSCLAIAETLQENSNLMIDKIIGNNLLVMAYQSTGNQIEIDQAQLHYDRYKASYECIIDLMHGDHSIDNQFDPEYLAIIHHATDELQMMQDHAQLRYRNLMAQGDANAIDPNSCFTKKDNKTREIN